jgi:hypothetical protein
MRTFSILPLALLLSISFTAAAASDDSLQRYLPAGAQASRAAPTPAALAREIELRSDVLFDAVFAHCSPDTLADTITDDFEFHHDQWGLIADSRTKFVDSIRKQCLRRESGEDPASRRERVSGTRTVYPSGESGAIETGVHRFYEIATNGQEMLVGIARYAHAWRREDGVWRVSRILSYEHMDVSAGKSRDPR